jgi:hypothetical protein
MNPTIAWREILDASGLADLACERHGHDLLDGIKDDAYGWPLELTFAHLCRHLGATSWADFEPVLERMRTIDGFEGLRIPDGHAAEVIEVRANGPRIGICDHTSNARGTYSDAWGTPDHVIEIVRQLYGEIDYDLASNDEANKIVRAAQYWTQQRLCPKDPDIAAGSVIWCNPPGPRWHVDEFWSVWCRCVERGAVGGFLIFKQDHWRALPAPPVPCTAVVLRKRLRFVGAKGGANFPSTLVLSGRLFMDVRRTGKFSDTGPALVWEPI